MQHLFKGGQELEHKRFECKIKVKFCNTDVIPDEFEFKGKTTKKDEEIEWTCLGFTIPDALDKSQREVQSEIEKIDLTTWDNEEKWKYGEYTGTTTLKNPIDKTVFLTELQEKIKNKESLTITTPYGTPEKIKIGLSDYVLPLNKANIESLISECKYLSGNTITVTLHFSRESEKASLPFAIIDQEDIEVPTLKIVSEGTPL